MKGTLLTIFLCVTTYIVFSQDCKDIKMSNSSPDKWASSWIRKLIADCGYSKQNMPVIFLYKTIGKNTSLLCDDNKVIFYNRKLDENTYSKFIIAHELSHHLLGHPALRNNDLLLKSNSHNEEFASDALGLYLLARSEEILLDSAFISELLNSSYKISNLIETQTKEHPAKVDRLRNLLEIYNRHSFSLENWISFANKEIIYKPIAEIEEARALIKLGNIELKNEKKIKIKIDSLEKNIRSSEELRKHFEKIAEKWQLGQSYFMFLNHLRSTLDTSTVTFLDIKNSTSINDYDFRDLKESFTEVSKIVNKAIKNPNSNKVSLIFSMGLPFDATFEKTGINAHFPFFLKAGFRYSRENFSDSKKMFFMYSGELNYNVTRMDVMQKIEGKQKVVERFFMLYPELVPRVGVGLRYKKSSYEIQKSTKQNYFSFTLGLPLQLEFAGIYYYKNYLTQENSKLKLNWTNKISTRLMGVQVGFHQVSRLKRLPYMDRPKNLPSWAVYVQFYNPLLNINSVKGNVKLFEVTGSYSI